MSRSVVDNVDGSVRIHLCEKFGYANLWVGTGFAFEGGNELLAVVVQVEEVSSNRPR